MGNVELINDLWLQIDKLHLSYLQTEESPERIEQKRKLEGYMKDYLSLVTANQRFYSTTTKTVLYSSILGKSGEHFSPAKLSHAWEMLGTYAAKLLGQPWRKEFKEIRLYSGAFKYQIEQYLDGAEAILMEMGYTLDLEFSRLVVQGMLDYDKIVRVHRDCLLAQVETLILGEIHSTLSVSPHPCSWAAIFDYRDSYVGSVAHCIRGLMYQQAQKESYVYPAPYLGPHELYPASFRPTYAYSYQLTDQRLPPKPEIWNNNNNNVVKSVPKFDSLLDIDRLEQLCYDQVDNVSSPKEKPKKPSPRLLKSNGARPKERVPSPQIIKWECHFCTYFNLEEREVCEMCSKSRNRGPESRPLHRGGRECSNCTLVNSPEAESCAACSTSLTHAPTYI